MRSGNGWTKVRSKSSAAVSEYADRLLRIRPQSKAALQGLAMLAMRNGDRTAATEYCKRLVEVDPDSFERVGEFARREGMYLDLLMPGNLADLVGQDGILPHKVKAVLQVSQEKTGTIYA